MPTNNIDIWSEFQKLYHQYQPPYRFNILSEQQGHIVENSHTNILMKILEYKDGDSYPFLQSFCENMFDNWLFKTDGEIKFDREYFCKGQNQNNNGRIDGLIQKPGCFAIIIENKINGAKDQKDQLCTYIREVMNAGFYLQQIWVLYLTREGGQPCYLENLAKSMECGVINDDNTPIGIDSPRYASINYCEDILDWLKEYVLPEVKLNNQTLYTGLIQYIDFLESMFSTENLPDGLINATYKLLDAYVQDDGYAVQYTNKVEYLHNLYKQISAENRKSKKDVENDEKAAITNALLAIIEKYKNKDTLQFALITKEYFEKVLGASCQIHSHFRNYYINIYCKEKWGKDIFFAWCPNSLAKIQGGKSLTFSVNFRTQELQDCADKLTNNQELPGGYKKADKAPSAWRIELDLKKEQWSMLAPKEDKLRETYKKLIPESLIELLDKIYKG